MVLWKKGVWAKSRKTRQIKHNEQFKHGKEELRRGNQKLTIQTLGTKTPIEDKQNKTIQETKQKKKQKTPHRKLKR